MNLGYSPSTAGVLDLEDAFKLAAELDFTFVELAWEIFEILPDAGLLERTKALSQMTGVGVSVHLPFVDLNLASLVPSARQTAVERVQRALAGAAELNAICGVLHTGQNSVYHPLAVNYAMKALDKSFAEFSEVVPIAAENLALTSQDLIQGPDALRDLTERAGFHNCLDFGHAYVEAGRTGERALTERYFEVLGEHIIHLHVHSNDGLTDQHRPLSEGSLPYHRYANFLRGFSGTVCLEVTGGAEGVRSSAKHLRTLVEGLAHTP